MAKAKFRLLHGQHYEGREKDSAKLATLQKRLAAGVITKEEFQKESYGLKPRRVYEQGDIIESEVDLCGMNGKHPMVPKFARADDDVAAMVPPPYQTEDTKVQEGFKDHHEDTLDSMTVSELQRVAEAQEIDISGKKSKAELIKAIRNAPAGAMT